MVGDGAAVGKWRNRCCDLTPVSPPTPSITTSLSCMRSWSKVIRDFRQEGGGGGSDLGVRAINRQTAIFVAASLR